MKTKNKIIQNTLYDCLNFLKGKAEEVANYADYLLKKYEDELITQGIQHLAESSDVFSFLDEDLYNVEETD